MTDISIHWKCVRKNGESPCYVMCATRDADVPTYYVRGEFIMQGYVLTQHRSAAGLTYWQGTCEGQEVSARGCLHLAMTDCERDYLINLKRAFERMGMEFDAPIPEVHRQGDLHESRGNANEVTA